MKSLILAAAMLGASAAAFGQVSARIEIGQPGFYGAIDIGDNYRPRLYAPQPVIIERHTHYIAEPVYLRVPSGHRQNWRRYCGRYDACGRRVYFVRDDWYRNTYAPRYRADHGYAYQPVTRVVERRVVEHHYVERDRHHGKHHDKHWKKHDKHHGRGHGHGHGKH